MSRRGERGSATPFAIACLGLLLVLAAALGVVGAMVRAHRQAQAAADLAALAAADALPADGCGVAGRVASANVARLVSCEVEGRDVRVRVRVTGPHWLGQGADLDAEARAGPG